MFQKISAGWELVTDSWEVLKLDKELLLFPLLSGISCLLVMATFAVPMWTTGYVESVIAANEQGQLTQTQQFIGYGILFAYYFVNYFVIIFFNSALVACSIVRFRGGDPTVAYGISAAMQRLPQIAGWAAVSATVGLALKLVEQRSEKVGRFVTGLLGMAWSAVTFFVIPVIVVERTGPIAATKRSIEILRKTWGEALSANFGIGFIRFIACLIAIIPIVAGVFAIANEMVALGIVGIVVGVLTLLIVSLISSALNAIILGALYLYAADGEAPKQFNNANFRNAFQQK